MSTTERNAGDSPVQISVRGLKKSFAGVTVLHGIDLDIERGRINVIIGGSGAGKSVLMKHLVGLLRPDEGQILLDGVDLLELNEVALNRIRVRLGMVFQYAALFDSMTVEENVMFPLLEHRRRSMSRKEMKSIVHEKLEALGLYNIEHKYPAELSGGMRKRVGLARAIVMEPDVLFYDEPTTGLDPVATKNVDDMIAGISQNLGVTSVVISHDMASTFRIGNRVSMLYRGEIVASGTPDAIRQSSHSAVQEFLETSGVLRPGDQAGSAHEGLRQDGRPS